MAGDRLKRLLGLGAKPAHDHAAGAAPYPSVELIHWQPRDGTRNFGDHLSQVIVAAVARTRGFTLDDEVPVHRRMIAIGSSLHLAHDGDTIWGSGVNGKIAVEAIRARGLDIRAVRGPKTAQTLRGFGMTVPNVFGDPGLLVPHFFGARFPVVPTRDYVIVPNLHDLSLIADGDRLVSPLWGWNRCVAAIVSARLVVASSLHGLIIAEAFGIPARYLRLSETESQYKYDDYAQGTGRAELAPARSVEQALNEAPHDPIEFDREALLAAFPYDLWTRS